MDDRRLKREEVRSVKKANLNYNNVQSLRSVGEVFPELEFLAISNAFLIQMETSCRRHRSGTLGWRT